MVFFVRYIKILNKTKTPNFTLLGVKLGVILINC